MKAVELMHTEFMKRHNERMAVLNSRLKECQETIRHNSEEMEINQENNQKTLQDINAALDALFED